MPPHRRRYPAPGLKLFCAMRRLMVVPRVRKSSHEFFCISWDENSQCSFCSVSCPASNQQPRTNRAGDVTHYSMLRSLANEPTPSSKLPGSIANTAPRTTLFVVEDYNKPVVCILGRNLGIPCG